MGTNAIEVEKLTKLFQVKQRTAGWRGGLRALLRPEYKEVRAVDDITFSIDQGELLAFIGPNGAGKSTTIKMLTGILFPTSGRLRVLGLDSTRERRQLAYRVGSVFGQKPQLWYHLPPLETYGLLAKIYELGEREYHDRLESLVTVMGIAELLRTPVRKLSLGERMRCEIVASLLHRPRLLFLDEPTIGLDVIAKQQIREVIRNLNQQEGVTVFLTSHDAGDVETLARRAIVLHQGRIAFDGSTEELRQQYLRSKVVELVAEQPIDRFDFPGAKVVERTRFSLKVELGPGQPADALLAYALANYQLADINIFDPPMEEVIAAIYRKQ